MALAINILLDFCGFYTNFSGKLSSIPSFLFPEHLHCSYLYIYLFLNIVH
jgi:hypothetical protein